ncbi:MAG: DUF116 domain-containing protein [Bacillota bacterium]
MKVDFPYIKTYVKKRLFLGLLGFSLLVAGMVAFALWYLIFNPGQSVINQTLVLALVVFISVSVIMASLGLVGILMTLLAAKRLPFLQGPMRVAVNIFFPVIIGLGKLFNIDVDRIKSSYIEVNNQMVKTARLRLAPEQILVLVPHCLQNSRCPYKITVDINNCRRCGGCCIGDLLAVRDRCGVKMGVATGGTLARKFVKDYRPRAVVAVACERDLTSGIQDSNPMPVLGITNERPFGPCFNTRIEPSRVEKAIEFFVSFREGGR